MISSFKANLGFYKNSRKDWSTSEKLLIIESDDWGSIRMPSKESFNNLLESGISVQNCPFMKFDCLETEEDFNAIETAFNKIFKETGKRPVITANYIMANPDFNKIREMNFSAYYRKFFFDFLIEENRLYEYQRNLNSLLNGKFIFPQLHGMEHLNVPLWMEFLREKSNETMTAFNQGVYGISSNITSENRSNYLAALDYGDIAEYDGFMKDSLKESYIAFQQFFGYNSKSFIAPNYVWSRNVEKTLSELGVSYIQSSRNQILPRSCSERFKYRNTGMRNEFGQIYLVRNCIFEPTTVADKKRHMRACIQQVRNAFLLNKPAIISMHKLNFVGGLNETNRKENLAYLSELLRTVTRKWPSVKFVNSVELGNIIKKDLEK